MSEQHSIVAEFRTDSGKGASRRLRREGKVPAIIYGGHRDPVALTLKQNELLHAAEQESFYSSIIEITAGEGISQQAVVRDMQRHPYKPIIMHVDFMRVSADEKLRISVPVHFIGESTSPAGKASGVVIQHQMTEIEIEAYPKDLPEFLAVDLSAMEIGGTVLLSDISLPQGVSIPLLESGDDHDLTVAHAAHVKESQGSETDEEGTAADATGKPAGKAAASED